MQASNHVSLESALEIRVVTAPYFLATKLEAFKGRGGGDYFASRDLEDFISVIDGRPSLLDELLAAPDDLRVYIATEVKILLQKARFVDALPGHLPPDAISQSRIGLLLARLSDLSRLA